MEICHNVQPVMQPHPTINSGGDCFACALTATLQHLFPENPPTFDSVYDLFRSHYANSDKECIECSWFGTGNAIERFVKTNGGIESFIDIVKPNYREIYHSCAWWSYFPYYEWSKRLQELVESGYLCLTAIDSQGRGPILLESGKLNTTDHTILIDGFKSEHIPHKTVENAQEVSNSAHIVCSVKGTYWIPVEELMFRYGAAALRCIRRLDN